jgi:hypothetical protein
LKITNKNLPLIGIVVLFLTPLLAAAILLNLSNVKSLPKLSHGHLAESLQIFDLKSFAGITPNKWYLVYVDGNDCDNQCMNTKHTLTNLHIALGANQERVQLLNLARDSFNDSIKEHSILIVDPHGVFIMDYPTTVNLRDVLKDLQRLLKYSHV